MELNNIPNDKDTTVITPMQEQIRNVPKTDVEPTTDFQVGELPKGGFAGDGYDSYELGKVTAKDAKKDKFSSGKKITYDDVDAIIKHHKDKGDNPDLTAEQKAEHENVVNAWSSKKVEMDKQVKKLAESISKAKNLQKDFTTEDWKNIRNYYNRNSASDDSDIFYMAIANSMIAPAAGATYAKRLGKDIANSELDVSFKNSWLKMFRAADETLRGKAAKDSNLVQEFLAGMAEVDKAKAEKLQKEADEVRRKEEERQAAEQKKKEEEQKKKAKPAKVETPKAVETPVTSEAEEVKPKNAAEEKLEEKVNVSLSTADALKAVGNDVYENAQAATENLGRKAKKLNDGKDLMSNLPDFAINKLLRNEFGDLTVDKNGKKTLNSKALGTYGWFVLDNLGAALVNASQVARGMTPTQKSAYKQYLENEMVNAIGRKNKLTESINDIQLQGLVSDKELLTTIGMERIKLGSSAIDNALRAYQSDIDTARFAKLLNENAQYLSTLSDTNKQEMLKFLALQAQDVDAQARILGFMQASALKAQLAKTEAEKDLASIQVQQGNLELQMKEKDIAKATQALDIMKAELEQKYKGLKMSDLQMEQLKLAIEQDTINNKYLDAKNVMELVNDGSSAVGNIIKSIIPGAK